MKIMHLESLHANPAQAGDQFHPARVARRVALDNDATCAPRAYLLTNDREILSEGGFRSAFYTQHESGMKIRLLIGIKEL